MTVRELIERLVGEPPDAAVTVYIDGRELGLTGGTTFPAPRLRVSLFAEKYVRLVVLTDTEYERVQGILEADEQEGGRRAIW